MTDEPKFKFCEVVKVLSTDPVNTTYHDLLGFVWHVSKNNQGNWEYRVNFEDDDINDLIVAQETDLKSTGNFIKKPKFNLNEIVQVTKNLNSIHNLVGQVDARSRNSNGAWSYGVYLFDKQEGWCFEEHELKTTGRFAKENDFYTGERLRVGVTPDGEGKIVGYYAKDSKYTDAKDSNFHKIFEVDNGNKGTKR